MDGHELGGDTTYVFTHILDNLCKNALDLTISKLTVDNNWSVGTYCQWLISAEDENSYITLEFQNIIVSLETYHLEMFYLTKMSQSFRLT